MEHIGILHEAVKEFAANWYLLGIQLGVSPEKLDELRSMSMPNECKTRLSLVLRYWVATCKEKPTVEELAKVLKSPSVGQARFAAEFRAKYGGMSQVRVCTYDNLIPIDERIAFS